MIDAHIRYRPPKKPLRLNLEPSHLLQVEGIHRLFPPHIVNREKLRGFGTKQTWVHILTPSPRAALWVTWGEFQVSSAPECCWRVQWERGVEAQHGAVLRQDEGGTTFHR